MSDTISTGGKRTQKSTCRKCNRTVYVVAMADGSRHETDPELIAVIQFEKSPAVIVLARRSHAEMCTKYQSDAERVKAQAALKRVRNGRG